ncbi:J domain-containing protein [Bradyrhizobium sp. ARR65]|uniref:J domain-containing protein n=1 Tax=Bradyrhizobium sp. ARR65 TaxID=1040989 RepID=UPI0009FD717B|nr:J domain-containing protein [Bradyrhizobium sp. ARR65]
METLYDLLGALPNDDAEELRAAFRRAVKGAHPDLNPGDPDAGLKFRTIVRANQILSDSEQRAVYDHLLELARREQREAARHAAASRMYKLASIVMALTTLPAATLGGYALLLNLSTQAAAPVSNAATETAAVTTAVPTAANAGAGSPSASARAELVALIVAPTAATEPAAAADAPAASIGPPLDITPAGVKSRRAAAEAVNRNGNPNGPVASLRQFGRAFAGIGRETNRPVHGPVSARKKPPRQAAEADLSRQEGFPSSAQP